jgi:transketolase
MEKLMTADERIIFITGDLGFNAFENLQKKMGDRFINAGVAEQNMIGVAAGMAYKGHRVFCYSIAPFIVYRCLEQFRNDVCLHNMPVFLVGNGGGYGYGIMGSSHHALEDIGVLSGLQNVTCHVPAFTEDVETALNEIISSATPAYLRLGADVKSFGSPIACGSFTQLKRVFNSRVPSLTIIAMGPVINNIFHAIDQSGFTGADLFIASRFPVIAIPEALKESIEKSRTVLVVEEHVATGGLAQQLSALLLAENIFPKKFISLHAKGYPGGKYGSQEFHRAQSGMDVASLVKILSTLN